MTKERFLQELGKQLRQLPPEEIAQHQAYYEELLADMLEDGMNEEEAVAKLGDLSEIVQEILQNTPLPTLVKSRFRPKKGWSAPVVILLILGSPLWFPLCLALIVSAAAILFAIWAVIAALFVMVLSLGIVGIAVLFKSLFLFSLGGNYTLFALGAGCLLLGLGCLAFLAAEQAAIALLRGGKWIYRKLKASLIKKEGT